MDHLLDYLMLALACGGMTMWMLRSQRRSAEPRASNVAGRLEEQRILESTSRSLVDSLEIRLYDYSRDVEARIQNRIEVLDLLVQEADRELLRLQRLLEEARRPEESASIPMSAADARSSEFSQRVFALHEAGFSPQEIAGCLGAPVADVDHVLNEWRRAA